METNYRPTSIEFDVDGGLMPQSMVFEFKEAKEALEFMSKHVIGLNTKASVSRFMDSYEKKKIREDYQDLLEQKIPMLNRELQKAKQAFDEAKKTFQNASEMVSATTTEAMALALDVKRGTVTMELDDMFTWRVAVADKYYIYTFMDNQIKLAKILDIPSFEKNDLFNAMAKNDEFFETHFPNGIIARDSFKDKIENE